MTKLYYARYEETEEEIVAFPTEQQRDDWVNFKDQFSICWNYIRKLHIQKNDVVSRRSRMHN